MTLRIDIWSDIACPWCLVGKRRLEKALEGFEHPVAIHWRSFELDPSAPREREGDASYAARLAKKYSVPTAQAEAMIARMTETGAADSIAFRFDRIRPGNTFDAHRLVHLAAAHGEGDAMKEAFFRAYLEDGVAIGDPEAIAEVAVAAGLDPDEVRDVLDSDRYASGVRQDEEQAAALGIRGVPCFVIERQWAIQGAQEADAIRSVLERARAKLSGSEVVEGAACGPDGC